MLRTTEVFFRAFEQYSNDRDIDGFSTMFAESFLAGGHQGSKYICTANFLQYLPTRYRAPAALGCSTSHLISISETPLGDRHLFVTTEWRIETTAPATGEAVTTTSSFLLEMQDDTWRIVAYVAHNDLEALLRGRE